MAIATYSPHSNIVAKWATARVAPTFLPCEFMYIIPKIFYIINMKKKINIMAKFAETSKVGIAGFFAGAFCLLFAIAYTVIYYSKKRE
jgi:hypothetical protein